MKRFLTILTVLFVVCFSVEGLAANIYDVGPLSGDDAPAVHSNVISVQTNSLGLFVHFLKNTAESPFFKDFEFRQVHGQPLPGVLITLLLGATFGLARKLRNGRRSARTEQQAGNAFILTARFLRMQISYLDPPSTIHTISPGPDLFCQRE